MFRENKYSPSQLIAIKSKCRNLMIIAGPGSGKTHTMTGRILYLTEVMKVSPGSILVITFTKDAALSMQKRFTDLSDTGAGVVFGTFHSVFYHMICEYKKPLQPSLFFENAKLKIASNIAGSYTMDVSEGKILSEKIISAITHYKNTLDAESSASLLPDDKRKHFKEIYDHFENIRNKKNLMDFDDMVYDCLLLLKNCKDFREKWSKRFRYILIDEFQDINPVQYETVKNLASKNTSIFAVGDDDQSIYGFRGSDPSCIKRFLNEMNAGILHLNENYRSNDRIVNSSLLVINENKNRIKKDLHSNRTGNDEDLVIGVYPDKESEFKAIMAAGNDKNIKTAVLFRTNLDMQYAASYFSAHNIPFSIREKTKNIFEHFIISDIFSYLGAAYLGDADMIKSIINKPQRYISFETIISCDSNIEKMISYMIRNPGIKNRNEKIKNLTVLKNDLAFMKNLSPHNAAEYLYNKIGYKKYVSSLSNNMDLKDEYSKILEKAVEITRLSDDYDELISIKNEYEQDLKRSKKTAVPDEYLNLMTVHASKGLEFDKVYIPDCNEGVFPHGKMQDDDTVEEERRLFYVGMTRAVNNLHLYYVSEGGSGKNIPSRFIYPLLKNTNKKRES